MMGHNDLALPLLKRAVEEWPAYAAGHRTLILVLVRLDRLSEACEAATRMRESIPGYRVGPEINVISNREYVAELRHALVISGIPE